MKLTEKQERRFWSRVDMSGECWEWRGAVHHCGYGTISLNRQKMLAHRVSWMMANGREPGDMFVCHSCDNPKCVRPDHLWLGTHDDNMADMVAKGRARFWGSDGSVGNAHWRIKIPDEDVPAIRASTEPPSIVAAKYGVNVSTIYKIRVGLARQHVGAA